MLTIGNRTISPFHPPYIIAEIGVNHDGSPQQAAQLIEMARYASADAVKFQFFTADNLLSKQAQLAQYQKSQNASDPVELLRNLELSVEQLKPLVTLAHSLGLHAIVTIFSLEHVESVASLPWDAFKSASPDIINLPLLTELDQTGKPLIISTGAADRDEIARTVKKELGSAFLHCVSAYPVPDDKAQLAGIRALKNLIDDLQPGASIPVGYSDHTTSIITGALAVAAGATILEKHITIDRTKPGPDHEASLEPDQFREYITLARKAWHALGPHEIIVQEIEKDVRTVSRQSIVTTRRIEKGETITRPDLTVKRPGTGIEPFRINEIVGSTAATTIPPDTPIQYRDINNKISTTAHA